MQRIRISMTGRTPLLCNNDRMVDPLDSIKKRMEPLTSKSAAAKTDDDHAEISNLEFMAHLYLAPGIDGPAIPTKNIIKCLRDAGAITREGTKVTDAVSCIDLFVPIIYDGPRDIEKLLSDQSFRDRRPVGIGKKRVMRTRPSFGNWALVMDGYLDEKIMDFAALTRIVEFAGSAKGLGDNRKNGNGRFIGKVVKQ